LFITFSLQNGAASALLLLHVAPERHTFHIKKTALPEK